MKKLILGAILLFTVLSCSTDDSTPIITPPTQDVIDLHKTFKYNLINTNPESVINGYELMSYDEKTGYLTNETGYFDKILPYSYKTKVEKTTTGLKGVEVWDGYGTATWTITKNPLNQIVRSGFMDYVDEASNYGLEDYAWEDVYNYSVIELDSNGDEVNKGTEYMLVVLKNGEQFIPTNAFLVYTTIYGSVSEINGFKPFGDDFYSDNHNIIKVDNNHTVSFSINSGDGPLEYYLYKDGVIVKHQVTEYFQYNNGK